MAHLQRLGWHWRIRIKSSFWLYRRGRPRCKVERLAVARGQACFWQQVYITEKRYGPVYLAVAQSGQGQDAWYVLSDELADGKTFEEYGLRFDIEENFLDDKSNGFQLEASLIRSAEALTRLCLVLAVTTLYLVAQGTEVVKQGKRRWVDPHWFRGQSYLKIGWNWVKLALSRGWQLIPTLHLSSDCDPEPAMASKRRWCPSIAWMKGRRSDVDRSLVELGVHVMWHARAQPFCHGPHRVRQTCCHARRDDCSCLGDPAR